jgi:hypothetical protein
MAYLSSSDITDSVVTGITLTDYLTRGDAAIVNLAREFGLTSDRIVEPIDYNIKQWGICWVVSEVCLEKMGKVDTQNMLQDDKYAIKYSVYAEKLKMWRQRITAEMFLGQVHNQSDMVASSGQLLRG